MTDSRVRMFDHVRSATPNDVRFIMRNLRPVDAVEQFGAAYNDRPLIERVTERLVEAQPRAIGSFCILDRDGWPAVLLGAYLVAPRIAGLHRAATARWPETTFMFFRFVREFFIPHVLAPNVDRAVARVPDNYPQGQWMLARLGLRVTGSNGGSVEMVWEPTTESAHVWDRPGSSV